MLVQDRDFWVKRLHPEDRNRALEGCTRATALRLRKDRIARIEALFG